MNHSRRMMQTHLNVKNHCLLKLFAPLFLSFTLELCAFICNQTSFQNIYTNLNYHNYINGDNFSEMISPTMMMETEVDTDTDTIEETDIDKNNIYEEVLNNETFRRRHNHSKLSTTSSIYRNSWWELTSNGRYNEVCFKHRGFLVLSNTKQFCRIIIIKYKITVCQNRNFAELQNPCTAPTRAMLVPQPWAQDKGRGWHSENRK